MMACHESRITWILRTCFGGLRYGSFPALEPPVPREQQNFMPSQLHSPMALALEEATQAARLGEVPVGAVIVDPQGQVVARAGNRTRTLNDPTAHAEILVIRAAAAALGRERLVGHALYVTLEPCAMCAAAIAHARLKRLCYGADDPKGGGVEHGARIFAQPTCHHSPEVVEGIGAQAAGALLVEFFRRRR